MNSKSPLRTGRYLLFLDILGFSELVETKSPQEVYSVIDNALKSFSNWEELNGCFKTIYFSDTFVFYQDSQGYGQWAFLDIYAIGGMILSALLSKGIPARGAIAFGEFEVQLDSTSRHQVYFGKALIEAYKAEQKEKWIGITITPSAWKPFEDEKPGIVGQFEKEKVWLRREDDTLLLNPFIKLNSCYPYVQIGEIKRPFSKWSEPDLANDILAFKFLREMEASYMEKGDMCSPVAIKYYNTIKSLKDILGNEIYAFGEYAAHPDNY